MNFKEVKITFKTITPLWTGDAWQENKEIRPSSLMGSLRFWFAFYWKVVKGGDIERLNKDGIPEEILKDNKSLLIEKIKESENLDEATDKVLEELGLSVPSRIFGCTGWKSRVSIKVEGFSEEELSINDIEFAYPDNINSKFWIEKVLFGGKNTIKIFKDIKISLRTTDYWWDNYLKDFFEFFKDKLILVGGKKSFGFGFVKLIVEDSNDNNYQRIDDFLRIEKIDNIPYKEGKKVLGYNFKYYLRRKEDKQKREEMFGRQGKASKIYVSNLLNEDNNSIYLLLINNPFEYNSDNQRQEYQEHIQKYSNYQEWLQKLKNQRG